MVERSVGTLVFRELLERNLAWKERLLGEPNHAGGILPDGIQHHRVGELRCDFTNDLNALSFEQVEMIHGAC